MAYPSDEWPLPQADRGRKPDAAPPLPDELAQTLAGLGPAGEAPSHRGAGARRSAPGGAPPAVWVGAAALVLLLVLLVQNTGGIDIGFLWMRGRVSLALALLMAVIAGVVISRAAVAASSHLRKPARRR